MEKSALLTYFDNSALCCVLCFFSRAWFYFQSFDLLITILLKNCNCVNCFLTGNLYFDKFKLINLNITVFRGSGYVSYLGVSPHFGRLLVKHRTHLSQKAAECSEFEFELKRNILITHWATFPGLEKFYRDKYRDILLLLNRK